ncbi:hypothetical protein K435DRAFT_813245 [Dendrothele bispora CBS 962.96]|uniref:Uncharacterized protein n=1 Tax=Dendrothele bispora (strain CBS 962.96) TaxID=1314807 RepID=A0A4S8KN02_DENBC|nr:hypothetical protein K435DRAFT_813245 [Dendrothele bispora CBS 962.96]
MAQCESNQTSPVQPTAVSSPSESQFCPSQNVNPCDMLAIRKLPFETNIARQNWSTLREATKDTDFQKLVEVLEKHTKTTSQQLGKLFYTQVQGEIDKFSLKTLKAMWPIVLGLCILDVYSSKIHSVPSSPTDTFPRPNETIPQQLDFTRDEKKSLFPIYATHSFQSLDSQNFFPDSLRLKGGIVLERKAILVIWAASTLAQR